MTNLIPLSYLNEVCFLSLNENDKKYDMVLQLAQAQLQTIIGASFYEEIVTQYADDTLTTDNDNFYEQSNVKQYLAWQTYFYYLKFANINATPTGIRTFNDENSSIASDVQMYSLEKNALQFVNTYKGNMLNYLKNAQANTSTAYPLYEQKCGNDFSFGITSINAGSDAMFKVQKSIIRNE
jgi:hypothetical protein